MIAFTPGSQRPTTTLSQVVGVFEDDALLLLLAARSRTAELGCSRASGPGYSDDLAFEDARRVDAGNWDF
jgi:hypothetical protein